MFSRGVVGLISRTPSFETLVYIYIHPGRVDKTIHNGNANNHSRQTANTSKQYEHAIIRQIAPRPPPLNALYKLHTYHVYGNLASTRVFNSVASHYYWCAAAN